MTGRIFTTKDRNRIQRKSKWIKIRYETVRNKNNSLWDYATDEMGYNVFDERCNKNSLFVDCFRHCGKRYAIGQFERMCYPEFFTDETGKESFLSGYDGTQWYKPYLIEIDCNGEYIRLYEELEGEA